MRTIERRLYAVLALAFVVSIVHYVDNTVNYAEYPRSGTLPNPAKFVVGGSWFLFTAFAVAGIVFLRRGEVRRAAIAFAAYSGSGLVGILHYSVGGTSRFPWWRHAHIVADITLGVTVLVLAFQLARSATGPGRPAATAA